MKKILLILAFIGFFAGVSQSDFMQTEGFFTILAPNVTITDLSFIPSTVSPGGFTDITVVLFNNGYTAANVTVNVSIYNSTLDFLENVTYTPIIVPAQTGLSIIQSYSTVGKGTGNFTGNATGFWD